MTPPFAGSGVPSSHLDGGRSRRQALVIELGVRVVVREVETLEDVGEAWAPSPVVPGDLLATELELYRVEVVLRVTAAARCVPVLGRRLKLP